MTVNINIVFNMVGFPGCSDLKDNTSSPVTMPTCSTTSYGGNRLVKYRNCSLLRDHAIVVDDLWVRGGTIVNPEKVFFDERVQPDEVIDCGNLLIAPGFIDVQINGGLTNN